MFEPFFTTKGQSGSHGGLGLGLSVSRSLVQAMGGELTHDHEFTGGTRFVVTLPLAMPDEAPVGSTSGHESTAMSSPAASWWQTTRRPSPSPPRICCAARAISATPRAKRASPPTLLAGSPYDLLIADIRMPGNVNLDLLSHVAHAHSAVPVILVTGFPSLDTAIRAIELPVIAYLVKPIDFDSFLPRVRAAVNGARVTGTLRDVRERLNGLAGRHRASQPTRRTHGSLRMFPASFETFLSTTSKTIMDCLVGHAERGGSPGRDGREHPRPATS